jgi:hypothetical protein
MLIIASALGFAAACLAWTYPQTERLAWLALALCSPVGLVGLALVGAYRAHLSALARRLGEHALCETARAYALAIYFSWWASALGGFIIWVNSPDKGVLPGLCIVGLSIPTLLISSALLLLLPIQLLHALAGQSGDPAKQNTL